MTEQKNTYVCGVCQQVRDGTPSGGFNTVHGTVVTCSGRCWDEGMAKGQPVTTNAMHAAAHEANKAS
jgi:hypothetical protein